MKANTSNNYESWAGFCLGWFGLVCFKYFVYGLFSEQQLIYPMAVVSCERKRYFFFIFLFLNTGKYSSWTKEDSKDTNISIPSQLNAGCCSLFVRWQHAWKQGHHAGMGGMLCSASSPARQAISAGVIGKGCRRQAKGHSSLASFLKRLLSTRKCP